MDTIRKFEGQYEFLSNFYPCKINYAGFEFQSSEALFMAHKSGNSKDFEVFSKIEKANKAKEQGRKVVLRDDWDDIKIDIMTNVVRLKFTQNIDLRTKLLATGDAHLVEGNWWKDTFWGMCNGVGTNHLGKILMKVRDEFNEKPRVGIATIVRKFKGSDEILLGQRLSSHMHGAWWCPGGHLEFGESPEDCARRETLEETNLHVELSDNWNLGWNSTVFYDSGRHYITLMIDTYAVDIDQLYNREPHKCKEWKWFRIEDIPGFNFIKEVL